MSLSKMLSLVGVVRCNPASVRLVLILESVGALGAGRSEGESIRGPSAAIKESIFSSSLSVLEARVNLDGSCITSK
jgi:hypothetical protein